MADIFAKFNVIHNPRPLTSPVIPITDHPPQNLHESFARMSQQQSAAQHNPSTDPPPPTSNPPRLTSQQQRSAPTNDNHVMADKLVDELSHDNDVTALHDVPIPNDVQPQSINENDTNSRQTLSTSVKQPLDVHDLLLDSIPMAIPSWVSHITKNSDKTVIFNSQHENRQQVQQPDNTASKYAVSDLPETRRNYISVDITEF